MDMKDKHFLESLSEIYVSIFALDLDEGEMHSIKSNPFIDKFISISGSLQDKMDNVMGQITEAEHVNSIHEFTALSTIGERMRGKNVISEVFEGKLNGWCKARFIRIDSSSTEPLRYVLYTVECIDEAKKMENYLRNLAQIDIMTGISNRGYGEESIEAYLREGRQGLFILFDIDKFKRINDVYGHHIGDKVLIAVADAMKQTQNSEDIVMRLGGDEFAAYFVDVVDNKQSDSIIANLLANIANIHIDSLDEVVSVSLGAVMYEEGLDFERAYQLADHGVYESKLNKGSSFIICNK